MDRARRAGVAALCLMVACAAAAVAAPPVQQPFAAADGPGDAGVLAGAVAWPPSADLVVAEIVTGGASASDEYVELTNAGPTAVDLVGLEVAYVTSSGSTVTRKASWATSVLLEPGRHLLIANALGVHAGSADATYSGGFSATGGALVLRPIGGAPIDAVAWGDATNAFVEGTAAAAPSPGSAIERRPGGDGGNTIDSNDNASDFVVQPSPVPQNLLAPPVPAPTPSSSPSPEPSPTPSPSPEPSPDPSPSPSPSPDPLPSPSPDPVLPIGEVRTLPDDSAVTVEGTVTAALGSLESGRAGFLQDDGGGIGVYLDAVPTAPIAAGSQVRVRGLVDTRFGQRTIRAAVGDVTVIGNRAVPQPLALSTGAAGEAFEGLRVSVTGTVTEAPSALADGLGLTVDDGSGPVRLIVGADALAGASPATGDLVTATGPLGQRDSTGTGSGGYRVHATLPGEFVVAPPAPSPSPSSSPSPSPDPSPDPSTAPSPSASPSPSPDPSPDPSPSVSPGAVSVATARAMPVGSRVTIAATVTAEAGRLGTPSLLAVGDAGAGIAVKAPPGAVALERGLAVVVSGVVAQPYGQLEIRAGDDGLVLAGVGALPAPLPVDGATLAEPVEGRLVSVTGTLLARPSRATSGDLTLRIEDAAGAEVRVLADASSGIDSDRFTPGTTYRLVGIAGQRASRKGRLDGYRIWLRDRDDVTTVGTEASPGAASPVPSPSPTAAGRVTQPTPIARAIVAQGRDLTIEGTVTAPASLLDATGRRIVVEDRTGAIEVLLPAGQRAPAVGDRLRASGEIGRAYGAPRLKADEFAVVGHGPTPAPRFLRGSPGPAHEWRLVRISGTVVDLVRLGERWRAEVEVGRERVVVSGLAGAGIASTTLVEGRAATVVGIVRRPYPSATDRRFAVVPRSPRDVAVGPAASGAGGAGPGGASPRPDVPSSPGTGTSGPEDVDLADLARHLGRTVRVGGLIVELAPDGFLLDDGTADASVVLRSAAAEYLPLLEPGDAVNMVGRVESADGGHRVVVEDPAGLVRVGDPGSSGEAAATAPAATPRPTSAADGRPARRMGDLGIPFGIDATGTAGMVSLGLISLASVAMTLLRRERARRRVARRIAVRLAAVATAAVDRREGPSSGPPSVA